MAPVARAAAVLGTAGIACLLLAASAMAHALPLTSVPASGADVAIAPVVVVVTFGETPDPALSRLDVLDVAGRSVTAGPTTAVVGDAVQLQVPLRTLSPGVYTVAWRTVSAVDGHLASGSFAFGVDTLVPATEGGDGSASAAMQLPSLPPVGVLGRWVLFVGLCGLLGATFVAVAVVRRPSRATLPLAWCSWTVAVVGTVIVLGSQVADAGVGLAGVAGTSLGTQAIDRGIPLALAAMALVVAVRRRPPSPLVLTIVAVAAALAMLADVLASHAAASGDTALAIVVQWLHFVAAGAWLGGLAALLLTMVAARPDGGTRLTVGRFARVATVGLALVAATGLLRAIAEVGSIDALVSTDFGRLVIAKSGLLVVLAGLGAVNHFGNAPRAGTRLRGLRRVGSTEVATGLLVLLLAAALVNLAPPSSLAGADAVAPDAVSAQPSVTAAGHDFGTSTRVLLSVSPGTAGFDSFTLDVRDYDTGAPIGGATVSLRFSLRARPAIGGSRLDLSPVGEGRYQATGGNVSLAGVWDVTATITHDDISVEVPMELATAIPDQHVDVQTTTGLPTIYTAHLAAGGTLQVYADPGATGPSELHVTFFDASGTEVPVTSASLRVGSAAGPSASPDTQLQPRMLEPGHFVADVDLTAGDHPLVITGSAPDGTYLAARIHLSIAP